MVNPSAGRGRTRKILPRLTTALEGTGLDVEIAISSDLENAHKLAADAFDRDRGVVACGGDGLVSELAGIAAESEGTLAIVPTGAGNDFARHLRIPHRRPLDAVAALTTGRVATVDLGRAEAGDGDGGTATRWFTTVANTGFDSEANRWANEVQRVSGTTLYVLAVVRTLAVYRPHRFRISVDGDAREVEAWLLAFGNGHCYAGGMKITPDAQVDDGLLDVCVVGPVSRLEFLRSFPRVFRGTHVTHPAVQMLRGREVVVESLDVSVPIELYGSGERVGPLPARLTAVPGAAKVMVPG